MEDQQEPTIPGVGPNPSANWSQSVEIQIRNTVLAAHYQLCQHYSDLLFKARVSITTLTLVVVGFVLGLVPERPHPLPELGLVDPRAVLALVASFVIGLLYLMEVAYLKRFYQVIASGRELEENLLPSYFARYDRSESWPLHLAYGIAVLVLVAMFMWLAWVSGQSLCRTGVLLILAALPVLQFAWSQVHLIRSIRKILPR